LKHWHQPQRPWGRAKSALSESLGTVWFAFTCSTELFAAARKWALNNDQIHNHKSQRHKMNEN
jgi:hypothetical protein